MDIKKYDAKIDCLIYALSSGTYDDFDIIDAQHYLRLLKSYLNIGLAPKEIKNILHNGDMEDVQKERTNLKKEARKSTQLAPRWAPEAEIEGACRWITKTVKPSKSHCGSDGEKACDTLCKKCWTKWKSRNNKNEIL